jgi:hypothetical protein
LFAVAAGVTALAAPSAASAASPIPPKTSSPGTGSAIDQYVEQIPTASGPRPAKGPGSGSGSKAASGHSSGLSPDARRSLRAVSGAERGKLAAVAATGAAATTSANGARTGSGAKNSGSGSSRATTNPSGGGKDATPAPSSTPSLPAAVASAVTGGSDHQLPWLAIVLVGVTIAAIGLTAYERRTRRPGRP